MTLAIAAWRKRKNKKIAAEAKGRGPKGPEVLLFNRIGGKELEPAHCPLCGRDWPLPGPVKPPEVDKASSTL